MCHPQFKNLWFFEATEHGVCLVRALYFLARARGGSLRNCCFVVAGTFHVPSAIQKPLVFEATAHGVCLLLSRTILNGSMAMSTMEIVCWST